MPTYDYYCDRCGHRFERFQKMSATPLETCPECGGRARRLIGTGAAVISKGSGSRATDDRTSLPACGRDRPCCGRDAPCNEKPCGK